MTLPIDNYYVIRPKPELLAALQDSLPLVQRILGTPKICVNQELLASTWTDKDYLVKVKIGFLMLLRSQLNEGGYFELQDTLQRIFRDVCINLTAFDHWWEIEKAEGNWQTNDLIQRGQHADFNLLLPTGSAVVDQWIEYFLNKKLGN